MSEFWAAYQAGVRFGMLAEGDRFRFPNDSQVFIRLKTLRYRRDTGGPSWVTSRGTTVIPIPKEV